MDTLASCLREVQGHLVVLHRAANAPPTPFIDHSGVLRDARTGRKIHGVGGGEHSSDDTADEDDPMSESPVLSTIRVMCLRTTSAGYSFFDSGDISMLGRPAERTSRAGVGMCSPYIPSKGIELKLFIRQSYPYGRILILILSRPGQLFFAYQDGMPIFSLSVPPFPSVCRPLLVTLSVYSMVLVVPVPDMI